jgi:hypothetical protein
MLSENLFQQKENPDGSWGNLPLETSASDSTLVLPGKSHAGSTQILSL